MVYTLVLVGIKSQIEPINFCRPIIWHFETKVYKLQSLQYFLNLLAESLKNQTEFLSMQSYSYFSNNCGEFFLDFSSLFAFSSLLPLYFQNLNFVIQTNLKRIFLKRLSIYQPESFYGYYFF